MVQKTKNISMLNRLKQPWVCYSLQLQQLQNAPSHQADHVGPTTEDTTAQFVLIIMEHIAVIYKTIIYLP